MSILPIKFEWKKIITLTSSVILTAVFGFFLLLNCDFVQTLTLKYFYLENITTNNVNPFLSYVIFGFPIVFVLDNLSLSFVFLTTLTILICILTVYKNPTYNSSLYYLLLWTLQFSLIHTFTSLNLLSFYVFFELTLVPMFLIIVIWGSRQRKIHAGYLFFFYTAIGSIFLLLGILLLYYYTNTLFIPNLFIINLDLEKQLLLWVLFFLGFAIKVPIVPFHTWLPEAHVEAPTTGSIILAALLLKIGTFGMLRFMFPILNSATNTFKPFVFMISILSIYHASIIALRQVDLKKLIAYSSVAHMGFVTLGLFSLNIYGFVGSLYIMISHGIVAGALFFLVGVLYDRYGSRNILDYGGLASTMPLFATTFFFFTLANLSFPGSSNFIGELFVLLGLCEIEMLTTILATLSIIFTSSYSI